VRLSLSLCQAEVYAETWALEVRKVANHDGTLPAFMHLQYLQRSPRRVKGALLRCTS
jgi:hypothetical protein